MIEAALVALAGLTAGAAANVPVEVLPRMILSGGPTPSDARPRRGLLGWLRRAGGRALSLTTVVINAPLDTIAKRSEDDPDDPKSALVLTARWTLVRRVSLAVLGAVFFLLAAERFAGDPLRQMLTSFYSIVFLMLAVTDAEHTLLPDLIIGPAFLVALLASPFLSHLDPWDGALGAVIGLIILLPLWLIGVLSRRPEVMGGGDVKLLMMMGAALGAQFLGVALYIGALAGGIVAVPALIARRLGYLPAEYRGLPYGTFLAIGGLIALFYGRPVIDTVLDILG